MSENHPLGGTLADGDRAILDLEARTYRTVGAKERDIRALLGITPMRYHVRLALLLDNPAAMEYAPAVVRRARAQVDGEGTSTALPSAAPAPPSADQ